jgi:Domain of unknown function (DUF4430)
VRAPAALALLLTGLALGGCGLGPGKSAGGAKLTVTRDFGSRPVGQVAEQKVAGSETVMRLLERHFDVATRYGGGFVQSIKGLSGSGGPGGVGRPRDWFYYVNGIEAERGAASSRVHGGDRIWWDRHDWSAAMRIPAVVGSFPEPFRSGSGGHRLPVRVECAKDAAAACGEVRRRLTAVGVPASRAALGASAGVDTLRVLVGPWRDLRGDLGAKQLERGPGASGVFARPAASGRTITVLDGNGRPARTLGGGSGLVAATRYIDSAPTWLVTGTDATGALAAARALDEGALGNHFALAVAADQAVPVPEVAR